MVTTPLDPHAYLRRPDRNGRAKQSDLDVHISDSRAKGDKTVFLRACHVINTLGRKSWVNFIKRKLCKKTFGTIHAQKKFPAQFADLFFQITRATFFCLSSSSLPNRSDSATTSVGAFNSCISFATITCQKNS